METEITRKVEDAVSTIVGIEHINSTISTGTSNTVIQFQFGTDLQRAMDDVRDAVSRIGPISPSTLPNPTSAGPLRPVTPSSRLASVPRTSVIPNCPGSWIST
jgi:multidrug efflux pump subunit AcrB